MNQFLRPVARPAAMQTLRRALSSATLPPLTEEMPGCVRVCVSQSCNVPACWARAVLMLKIPSIPKLKPARELSPPVTRMTTLDNGMKVVTEDDYKQVSCVGAFVNGGSRFEPSATVLCNARFSCTPAEQLSSLQGMRMAWRT